MTTSALEFVSYRSHEAEATSPWLNQILMLGIIAALASLALTPAAPALRLLFPAASGMIAAWFALRGKAAQYVSFTLWLFMLTPLIRRLVDMRVGFSEVNVLMLAPYAAGALSLIAVPKLLIRRDVPGQLGLIGVFAAPTYGLLVAFLYGRSVAGAFDYLRWIVPPAFAAYIILNSDKWREMLKDYGLVNLIGLPLLSAYALYQFVAPPRWDALWMVGSGMTTIGFPLPFLIRVFGTMNSPGSFASFLMVAILVVFAMRSRFGFVGILLGLAALAATLVRGAWLGLLIGLSLLFWLGSWRVRIAMIGAVSVALLAAPLLALSPQVEKIVGDRLSSLTQLSRDLSAQQRSQGYALLAQQLDKNIEGMGMGSVGTHQSYTDNSTSVIVDGGPIEIFMSVGVIGGSLYLGSLAFLVVIALMIKLPSEAPILAACKAVVFVLIVSLSSGTTVIGEVGMLLWTSVGILVAVRRG